MNNEAQWKPTKYVVRGGRLRASRDPAQLGVGSRVIADAVAARYGERLPLHARGRLLDLGCGHVPLYAAYRPHVASVTCVDWAHSLHANPFLDQLVDLNGPLPFADGAYETVILSDVLEHLAEPQPLLGEIARVLAPGGRLLMNLPFLYRIHEAPHDYARYTAFALRRFVQRAGLTTLELQPLGGSLAVFADLLGKHLEQAGAPGRWLAAALAGAATALLRRGPLARADRASAEVFPLGYFLVAERPRPRAATP
jgi:SAM-dependent methyltransferase